MGLAPLFGWRKSSGASLRQAFMFPGAAALGVAVAHAIVGHKLGYPAVVYTAPIDAGFGARIYASISSTYPGITVALAAFNIAVILQEFQRGIAARRSSAEKKGESESFLEALFRLVGRSRRRYGGYLVHLGITAMFLGFVGTAWSVTKEVALSPGDSTTVFDYSVKYTGTRMCPGSAACSMEENQVTGRRMLFADLEVSRAGKPLGKLSPAKFIYQSPPQTTSEIGLLRGFRDDLYTVLATADPKTKRATFSLHVNPFVAWIWIGLLVLMFGCTVSLWPDVTTERVRSWSYVRVMVGATTGVLLSFYVAQTAAHPFAPRLTQAGFRAQELVEITP
jgi:cytochrome c-type biogenesis protein CcmF